MSETKLDEINIETIQCKRFTKNVKLSLHLRDLSIYGINATIRVIGPSHAVETNARVLI